MFWKATMELRFLNREEVFEHHVTINGVGIEAGRTVKVLQQKFINEKGEGKWEDVKTVDETPEMV